MKRVLANDGIDSAGKQMLEAAGIFVDAQKATQAELISKINDGNFDVVLVRSATKIRQDVIEGCPGLKLIGRAGVGLDNIDVKFAESKGVKVVNTPAASSQSVAELVFAHLFAGVRFLHRSNHEMRTMGHTDFAALKKDYSAGTELKGKTIGIIGFGRIGQATARIAIGCGMKVIAFDPYITSAEITLELPMIAEKISTKISTINLDQLLAESDFISLHVPGLINGKALIGHEEIAKMKKGASIVNAARGGVVEENAILDALNTGQLKFVALDVFNNEPTPDEALLVHPDISLSPHIGAATEEAQERIGLEMARQIIDFFG
jgi:D-3-phosphoglycerate dehydrogenase